MKFWISAEMESDIAEEFRLANNELEEELTSYFVNKDYDFDLESLDCIAIIRNDSDFEEMHRYSLKNKDMDFRLIINYEEFKSSDIIGRKVLILNMLLRASDILSLQKGIDGKAIAQFKKDLNDFASMKHV